MAFYFLVAYFKVLLLVVVPFKTLHIILFAALKKKIFEYKNRAEKVKKDGLFVKLFKTSH